MIAVTHQVLPSTGPQREALREKGQFWTPPWLAKVMAYWVTEKRPVTIFDPAVGPGTFFSAAREVGYTGLFDGFELHETALEGSTKLGLTKTDLERIVIGDFISKDFRQAFPGIISNPPYIRHHRLNEERKAELRILAERVLGFALDGRVGLHVFFLLKCLEHLSPLGRLAFLLPADVCEGVSSKALWNRICALYRLEAVLTFDESAAPFPTVDTNAMVFLISRNTPGSHFKWLRVTERNGAAILSALGKADGGQDTNHSVICHDRTISDVVATGFSRPPRSDGSQGIPLSHFARIVRGIATGANEFFFLTREQRESLSLDSRFFIRAVGRTRDCRSDVLSTETLEQLDRENRPTFLLSLDNTPKERLPQSLQRYLESGERSKHNERALIQTRRPWYKMEQRTPPPLLFAYLGRRDCRFILNKAGVVPLTGFLCVYPHDTSREATERLWRALNHPETIANLAFAGKSYGGGAVKVEPRQLDTLEIPLSVLKETGLEYPSMTTERMLLENQAKYGSKKSPGKIRVSHQPIVYPRVPARKSRLRSSLQK